MSLCREIIRIIHGSEDQVIPISISKDFYKELQIENKEFIEIESAGHNNLFDFQEPVTSIKEFLN